MAELYQSEFTEIKQRRGVQDLDNLIALLDADGSITVEEDPSEEEILAAREKAAADAQKQADEAQAQAEADAEEDEAKKQEELERFKTARIAGMPVASDSGMDEITTNPPEGSETAEQLPAEGEGAEEKSKSKASASKK